MASTREMRKIAAIRISEMLMALWFFFRHDKLVEYRQVSLAVPGI
jgi:hypothetical protein